MTQNYVFKCSQWLKILFCIPECSTQIIVTHPVFFFSCCSNKIGTCGKNDKKNFNYLKIKIVQLKNIF